MQQIRYAFRMLAKHRGFTAVAVLSLTLSIGAATAMYSIVNGVLLRRLPYPQDDRLVSIVSRTPGLGTAEKGGPTPAEMVRLRQQSDSIESIGGYYGAYFPTYLSFRDPNDPRRFRTASVALDLFATLGYQPLIGRNAAAADMPAPKPGQTPAEVTVPVLISWDLWQSKWGGDPKVLNTIVPIGPSPCLILGIMPRHFQLPADLVSDEKVQVWMPLPINENNPPPMGRSMSVIARLKPAKTTAQLQSELDVVVNRLRQEQPKAYPAAIKTELKVVPLREDLVGDVRPTLLLLMAAVLLVLLIACLNVASLLLARATARRREMALRATLGAGRAGLVKQLLTESILLCTFAVVPGLLLAYGGLRAVLAIAPAGALPRAAEVSLDWRVLLFTIAISGGAALLFGLVPAFQVSRLNLTTALREEGRSATVGGARQRLRSALVVAEISLAFVLVIGAGLLLRSFTKLTAVDPGFNPEHVLTARISLPIPAYPTVNATDAYYRAFREKMKSLPGVIDASGVNVIPLSGPTGDSMFEVEGRPPAEQSSGETAFPHLNFRIVLPGYFEVMEMRLLRGRFFNDTDRPDGMLAGIINETFARRFFSDEDPTSKRMRFYLGPERKSPWVQIVGVVADSKLRALGEEPAPEIFELAGQVPQLIDPSAISRIMSLLIKFDSPAILSPEQFRQQMKSLDPLLAVFNIEPLQLIVDRTLARPRFNTAVLSVFAALAFLLAVIGVYGLISYSVGQRTREIGIRMALGAERRNILKMIVGHGSGLALVGIAMGLGASLAATRMIGSLLYGITATDPLTFVLVTLVLIVVAVLASYIPARRAAGVDPLIALRVE
jgi:putative ABC transport system permease protein